MKDLAILVVLYNSTIKDSETIKSLMLYNKINEVDVVIWNNGPRKIDDVCDIFPNNFRLVETIENISLARIYNVFLKEKAAERYLILDGDSKFSSNQIDKYRNSTVTGCIIPKVIAHGKQQYPLIEIGLYPFAKRVLSSKSQIKNCYIMSIASGLSIDRKSMSLIIDNYGCVFDENYKLYGIDTTFFYRAAKSKVNFFVSGEIKHSLSRLESESLEKKIFRVKERAIDVLITLRKYP
ncbi:hypothetical protein NMS31_003683, partial [Vibrio cholerae]|nr:hypothetical protein [Vibrio cholerae]